MYGIVYSCDTLKQGFLIFFSLSTPVSWMPSWGGRGAGKGKKGKGSAWSNAGGGGGGSMRLDTEQGRRDGAWAGGDRVVLPPQEQDRSAHQDVVKQRHPCVGRGSSLGWHVVMAATMCELPRPAGGATALPPTPALLLGGGSALSLPAHTYSLGLVHVPPVDNPCLKILGD